MATVTSKKKKSNKVILDYSNEWTFNRNQRWDVKFKDISLFDSSSRSITLQNDCNGGSHEVDFTSKICYDYSRMCPPSPGPPLIGPVQLKQCSRHITSHQHHVWNIILDPATAIRMYTQHYPSTRHYIVIYMTIILV